MMSANERHADIRRALLRFRRVMRHDDIAADVGTRCYTSGSMMIRRYVVLRQRQYALRRVANASAEMARLHDAMSAQ